MDEKRTNSTAWVATAMLLLIALLSAYAAAYLLRSEYSDDNPFLDGPQRDFSTDWEASFFTPAARLESAVRGRPVEITHPGYVYR